MIPKLQAGILTKIPHLKGASKEDANIFFNSFEKTEDYSMHQINDDWYLDFRTRMDKQPKDTDNTIISGYSLKRLQEFSNKVAKVIEYANPNFYKDLENWCNPQAYFFVGYWEDIEKSYKEFQKSIED